MFELLTILIVVWAAKAATDKARKEYRGVRDHHAANLARENPGWHPARIKRHAALRAQAHWWNELSHHTGKRWQPLPSFRAAFGESRLRAKAEAAEAHADGAESRHALRQRVRAAAARTEAVKAASGGASQGAPEGAPGRASDGAPWSAPEGVPGVPSDGGDPGLQYHYDPPPGRASILVLQEVGDATSGARSPHRMDG